MIGEFILWFLAGVGATQIVEQAVATARYVMSRRREKRLAAAYAAQQSMLDEADRCSVAMFEESLDTKLARLQTCECSKCIARRRQEARTN